MRLAGRVALVTGASSGIGRGIAEALAANGASVALVSRRISELEVVAKAIREAGGKSVAIQADVSKRGDVVESVQKAEQAFGAPVDILVNAAGVMYFTLMKNLHWDEWEQMTDVNCKGLVNSCGAVLSSMIQRRSGHIVNISSDAARTVFPALSVYNATKAFVTTFSKGLRAECVGTGVKVTDIQPGDVATNLIVNNTDREAAAKLGVGIGLTIGEGAAPGTVLNVSDIADAVLYALTAPAHVGIHEILIEPRDQMFGDPTAMNV
eukprot:c27775_g1_i1.p1 GENE.c27775_g1_i1~~c27775_g1_i1.p1  ORF type:complete len:265 (-),score=66.42 c27775_g1_i1:35-829(-)